MTLSLGVVSRDVDEIALCLRVLWGVEENTGAWLTIAPGTPCLLIVGFDVFRHVVVNDIADIALVDAHAEGVCRDDRLHIVVKEIVLRFCARGLGQSRMIAPDGEFFLFQVFVESVDIFARCGVDDAGLFCVVLYIGFDEFFLIFAAAHFKVKVWTVESCDVYGRGP